uniref:Uncharacterized protein n=1 Tax=Trichogramma kaykai TaxID=54128 RepID=A0ABD2X2H6_9HYME
MSNFDDDNFIAHYNGRSRSFALIYLYDKPQRTVAPATAASAHPCQQRRHTAICKKYCYKPVPFFLSFFTLSSRSSSERDSTQFELESNLKNFESRSFIDCIIRVKIFLCTRWEVYLRRYSDAFQQGQDLLKPDPLFLLKSILRKSQSSPTQSQVGARLEVSRFLCYMCTRVPPAQRIICSGYPQGLCVRSLLPETDSKAIDSRVRRRKTIEEPTQSLQKSLSASNALEILCCWTCCTCTAQSTTTNTRRCR